MTDPDNDPTIPDSISEDEILAELKSAAKSIWPEMSDIAALGMAKFGRVIIAEIQKGQETRLLPSASDSETRLYNDGVFASTWRPAVGWICVAGLSYEFLIYPVFLWISAIWFPAVIPPKLADENLFELVLGILGLTAARTVEKVMIGRSTLKTQSQSQ